MSLTACSTTAPAGPAECQPAAQPGAATDLVSATGAIGELPEVELGATPLATDEMQRAVLVEGDGDEVRDGAPVALEYSIYNGGTGELYQRTAYGEADPRTGGLSIPALITAGDSALSVLTANLTCATAGSRIVVTAPGAQVLEENPQVPFDPDESVVFVIDVLDSYLPKADGTEQLRQAGMPSVVLGVDGTPGVTIPDDVNKPTEATAAVLKRGTHTAPDADGDDVLQTVAADDTVVLKYSAVSWDDAAVIQGASTWENGQAVRENLAQPQALPTSVTEELVGLPVGSQVMVLVPSAQAGGEDVLIIVVDVLGIDDAA